MNSLDRAIEVALQWKPNRHKDRAEVLSRLENAAQQCQTAAQVWKGYLDKPGTPGDHWTILSWIGPDRTKQLHDINLRAKQDVEEVCRMAGPEAGRFIGLEETADVVEMAYRMLKPDETGVDAAKAAVQKVQERTEYLRGLIARLRAGKPAATKATARASEGKSTSKITPKKKKAKITAKKRKAPAKK